MCDSVVFMVCLGCHCSPFDGLGDEGSISYMCISLAHPLSKECGANFFFCLCHVVNGIV